MTLRKKYNAAFKFKIALEARQGGELLQKYQLTPIKSKIVLFKASESWDFFEPL